MSVFEIIGGILMILLSVGISLLVLVQESPKGGGLASLGGGDSYLGKNQGRTRDAVLGRLTKYAAIIFILITIAVYALDVLG